MVYFNLAKNAHPYGMQHYRLNFTRVFTVCEITCLGVSSIQRVIQIYDSSICKYIIQTCPCIYLLDWSHKTDSQNITAPEVIQLFVLNFNGAQNFNFSLKLKCRQMKKLLALGLSDNVFIVLINVKMPTIVGILTFMSRINFVLS